MAAQVLMLEALSKLTVGLDKAVGSMEESISLFDQGQKTSLALGQNLDQARTTLGPSIDNLRGSIDNKLSIGLAGLAAGLQGNTEGISTLANQQQLTGQDFKKTFKVFSELISVGGVQSIAANELADQVRKNSVTYGVTSEALVGALKSVEQTLAAQNLLGFGTEIQGAIVELQGVLGPELQGQLTSVVQTILKPGTDSLAQLSILGIGDVRSRIEAARGDQAAILSILRESLTIAGRNFEKLAGGSEATFTSFGILEKAIGIGSADFSILSQKLQEGGRIRQEGDMNYADTIATITAEVWNPLKEAMLPIIHKSLPLLRLGADYVSKGIGYVAENLDVFGVAIGAVVLPVVGVFVAALKGLKIVVDPLIFSVSTLFNAFKSVETSLLSMPATIEELELQLMLGSSKFFAGVIDGLSDMSFDMLGGEFTPFDGLKGLGATLRATSLVLESEFDALKLQNERIAENTKNTADNTKPSPNRYLVESNGIIEGAISKVLGIKENKTISLQEQMVDALHEVNDRLADNKPSPVPQFGGSL